MLQSNFQMLFWCWISVYYYVHNTLHGNAIQICYNNNNNNKSLVWSILGGCQPTTQLLFSLWSSNFFFASATILFSYNMTLKVLFIKEHKLKSFDISTPCLSVSQIPLFYLLLRDNLSNICRPACGWQIFSSDKHSQIVAVTSH